MSPTLTGSPLNVVSPSGFVSSVSVAFVPVVVVGDNVLFLVSVISDGIVSFGGSVVSGTVSLLIVVVYSVVASVVDS